MFYIYKKVRFAYNKKRPQVVPTLAVMYNRALLGVWLKSNAEIDRLPYHRAVYFFLSLVSIIIKHPNAIMSVRASNTDIASPPFGMKELGVSQTALWSQLYVQG